MLKSYSEALAQLPAGAKWACSFGYPGVPGFSEYWRDQAGGRYCIGNGPWHGLGNEWTCKPELSQ